MNINSEILYPLIYKTGLPLFLIEQWLCLLGSSIPPSNLPQFGNINICLSRWRTEERWQVTMENPASSPKMWKECWNFLWLKWTPQEETRPQPSCWNPIPEGGPLGADIQGAKSYTLCCMRQSLRGP